MKTAIVVASVLLLTSADLLAQTAAAPAASAAAAAEPPYERKLFSLQNVYAPTLAQTISKIFNDGKGPSLTVVPEQATNAILISAPAQTLKEVGELIAKLDRKPAVIGIDVWIIDSRGDVNVAAKPVEPLQGGQRKAVLEKLSQLEKEGRATVVNHFYLKTIDNQPSFLQQGEKKPRTVATTSVAPTNVATTSTATTSTATKSGRTATSTYDNVGTIVRVQPRANAENQIVMSVDVEKSLSAAGPKSVVVTQPEDGSAVRDVQTPITIALLVQTTVSVPNGEILNLTSFNNAPSEAASSFQVLVSAQTE